jgi:sporulation protein YlmC with PRC-barrel domain
MKRTGTKPQGRIQLVGGLLDLPILDSAYRYCGIVDDIELEIDGSVARVTALLVGPGAYRGRLPAWCFRLVCWAAGDRIVRVPWDSIAEIGSAAVLRVKADELGLHKTENRVRGWIPRWGAI